MTTYAFFGAGVMGETLLAAVIRSGVDPGSVLIVEKRAERAEEIARSYAVRAVEAVDAAVQADVAVLVVKPQDMVDLLSVIGPHLRPGSLAISIAAGITTATLERYVAEGVSCVRAMPNTPALLGEGMTGVSGGVRCTAEALAEASDLMALAGRVLVLPEDLQDALTAVSGSGPAYVFWLAEALREAGVDLGLSAEQAGLLVEQTIVGAAAMLRAADDPPELLRQRVTSPGGTTAAAIGVLDGEGGRDLVARALAAAVARSRELSGETPVDPVR